MSVITSIYDGLAGVSITAAGKTPKVRNYDEIKETFEAADAPTRMLLVPTGNTEAREASFIALGKLQKIEWRIEDRLYWSPVAQGQGLSDFTEDLLLYAQAYVEAIRDNRSLTASSHITRVRCVPTIVRWPDIEAGTPYAGARCIVVVEEIVAGA